MDVKSEQYKPKIMMETFFNMIYKTPTFKASAFLVQVYVYCNCLLEVFYEMKFLALFMGHSFFRSVLSPAAER